MAYELEERIESLLGPSRGSSINRMYHCPLGHEDRVASFSIHMTEGVWRCFSCGRGGSIESLYKALGEPLDEDLRFERLIRSAYAEPVQKTNLAPLANEYRDNLKGRAGQNALERYLQPRNLPRSIADHFGLGFTVRDTPRGNTPVIALPYWEADGRVSGIKFRAENGFKFAADNSHFGLYNSPDVAGKPVVYVGEGESDTHQLWGLVGQEDGIAVCGTSGASLNKVSWERLSMQFLFARTVYLCYDSDREGDRCADVATEVLGPDRCIRLRPSLGKDWTEAILNGEDFHAAVSNMSSR